MNKNIVKELLSFNTLFTSTLLVWIYRVVLVFVLLFWVLAALGSMRQSLLGGLGVLICTPFVLLGVRIYFELLYVVFGIFDQLKSMNKKLDK